MRRARIVSAFLAALSALVVAAWALPDARAVPPSTTTGPGTTAPPPPGSSGDYVRVNEFRQLSGSISQAVRLVAADVGGRSTFFYGGTIGLTRVLRESTVKSASPTGFRYPVTFAAVSIDDARGLFGLDILRAIARGDVVMNVAAAERRGVEVGDEVRLVGWNRAVRQVRVGALTDVVGAEVLFSKSRAHELGLRRPSYVLVWGFSDRAAVDSALTTRLAGKAPVRISRSWDEATADETLSSVGLKAMLGEFAIRGDGSISVDATWRRTNITTAFFTVGGKRIIKSCHKLVIPFVQQALDRITAEGLASEIDVKNSQRYGGCFHPRAVRAVGGTSGGNVSTHTWGGAIDFNPTENCMGCRPKISCRVVQIFRELGFAWGGNFLTRDGMHFEYVGEPRHTTPSRPTDLCPTTGTSPPLAPLDAHDFVVEDQRPE